MTRPVPDEELMMLVRNGASDMLAVLFDRYQVPLFSFYSKLTGNRTASEDLVQEVFFRILKYRRSYRPGSAFRPWIYQIARNTHAEQARRQRPETGFDAELAPHAQPRDTAARDQEEALLHQALLQLPEEKREVLLLSRFQGLPYNEIAELSGCEVGAIKVRVHRALQDLREIFLALQSGGASTGRKTKGATHGM
ncbi:MAG TPA: RNA polymerase sigma factor [Candidatus Acidoferrales bacterium]|nr:RNA polymerase sigma factor [Candidatus Acidoferrales bacterium]